MSDYVERDQALVRGMLRLAELDNQRMWSRMKTQHEIGELIKRYTKTEAKEFASCPTCGTMVDKEKLPND